MSWPCCQFYNVLAMRTTEITARAIPVNFKTLMVLDTADFFKKSLENFHV